MRIVVSVVLVLCSLAAAGCDDKKPDGDKPATTAAATSTAKPAPAPAKTAAPGGW
jgi:hypothetical protein